MKWKEFPISIKINVESPNQLEIMQLVVKSVVEWDKAFWDRIHRSMYKESNDEMATEKETPSP